ncbi:hypothetical protein OLX02_09525 [Novosphingobium sp. KCTC 2891]|uniref:hypothetical protein n=1 Tax=Novosphingobium sp. KCTC 2891 TaxID=2989730 RepID=UPI002221A15D|nr:hypothetical protein [Novosphingobium sp. KCTC 2891]MCW1383061.1 hypothetical protein [Novosphingobium sp. KCTC 2891]
MSGCSAAPARKPKRPWLGWVLLLGALGGLVIFAATFGHRRQAEEMRHLLFANSALSAAQLSTCLMERLPLEGRWLPGEGSPERVGAWNGARDLMVEVFDAGAKGRRVEISSLGGRSLRPAEAEALRRCLAGG